MELNLFTKLSTTLPNLVEYLEDNPSMHYKVFKIPKRTIGFRVIAQPTPKLKTVQSQLVDILRESLKVHPVAMAYQKGTSIVKNAGVHIRSDYILKVDLEDFFNSIVPKLFIRALQNQGVVIDVGDRLIIEQLLFWNKSKVSQGRLALSVGAPSSPFISNVVMFEFDLAMSKVCEKQGIVYSRYADDLSFSTKHKNILFEHLKFVRKLLKQEFGTTLTLNESKTVFTSKAHNRRITGITLTNNNKLSVGRNRRRYISSLIHKFKFNELSIDDIHHLKGLLAFVSQVEKDFEKRMAEKYGNSVVLAIKKFTGGE